MREASTAATTTAASVRPLRQEVEAPAAGRFRWSFALVTGLTLLALLVLVGVAAPLVMAHAANTLSDHTSRPMSAGHWFGTDEFGRDMLARSFVATRLSLLMATAATLISVVLGVMLGAGLWVCPRALREAGLRLVETAVSYPGLLIALIVTAILGAGGPAVVIGIGVAGIPAFARLTANLASSVAHRDFVVTARLLGVPPRRIVSRHILPTIAEPMLILVATGFAVALMELSALSFVGLGVQSPHYDYGKLLVDALPAIYTRPTQVVGPALMIVVAILGAMLVGDGLAAAADPRSSRPVHASRTSGRTSSRTFGRTSARTWPDSAGRGHSPMGMEAAPDSFVLVEDLRVATTEGIELVHGVSFSIARGEVVGIVGESGSGKSLTAMSLARLLADGLESCAAQLRIGELDLRHRVPARELATNVALVYQDPGTTFSPALRMGSQLGEVLRSHRGLSRGQARERVLEGLRAVRLTDPERRLRQHPHELSGGMRQRAMIAAALINRPQLIIADEPTTALDVTVQAEILRELKRLNRQSGTSLLFISHDIAVVEELCDRVLVMKDGLLVEELTRSQLAEGEVRHPYTRTLIAATPRLQASVTAPEDHHA